MSVHRRQQLLDSRACAVHGLPLWICKLHVALHRMQRRCSVQYQHWLRAVVCCVAGHAAEEKLLDRPLRANTRTFFGAWLEEIRRACGVVCLTTCTSMASCISQSRAMYGDPATVGKEVFYVCPSEGGKQPHRC